MKASSLPSLTDNLAGQMGLQANKRDWLLARKAMKTVWTVARMRVKVQLPSKVAIKEGWGRLVEVMETARRETRWRRSLADGWLAGIKKLRMFATVRRPDWIKTMLCWFNAGLTRPKALLFRLMTYVILW